MVCTGTRDIWSAVQARLRHALPLLLALLLLATAACHRAPAQPPAKPDLFAGTWVMHLDQQVFMVLRLEKLGDGYAGALSHPERISTDGYSFSAIAGMAVAQSLVSAARSEGTLRVAVQNPTDATDNTQFEITVTAPGAAAVKLAGAPFPAWRFTKHNGRDMPAIATTWDATRVYQLEVLHDAPNVEMQTIYAADRAAHESPEKLSVAQWEQLDADDAVRRERTRALLAAGALTSSEDFRNAALIFQHGSTSQDYLLAHTLALAAVAKGDAESAWIAAAALDRYLHAIGQSQIYGTQFADGKALNQEPYDRGLIPDALRRALKVPAVAEQIDQFRMAEQGVPSVAEPKEPVSSAKPQ